MAQPKKKNLNPKINLIGKDRQDEISDMAIDSTNFLPKGVLIEDLDLGFVEDFIDKKLDFTIDGKKVPVVYMTKERWADYANTWKIMGDNGEITMPYITVSRVGSPKLGNNSIFRSRIAQNKKFKFYRVPTMEDGVKGFDIYKIPQPTPVECNYEIKLFTHYQEDVDLLDEKLIELFSSIQLYIIVNGFYIEIQKRDSMPEGITNSYSDRNFYVNNNQFIMNGFLLNPDTFEQVRSVRSINLNFNHKKSKK